MWLAQLACHPSFRLSHHPSRRGLDRDAKDVSLQRLELRIRILRWRGRVLGAIRKLWK